MSQNSDASSVTTYMFWTDGNVVEVIETGSSMFSDFLDDGFKEGELERAKRLVKGVNVRSMESTEHRLYRLKVNHMPNGSTKTLDERLARIDAVTEEDIMRVTRNILGGDCLNIVVLAKDNGEIRNYDASAMSL